MLDRPSLGWLAPSGLLLSLFLGAPAASAAAPDGARVIRVLDVSMDAINTWSSSKGDFSHFAENVRGDTFIVRGSLYPGGTIPEGNGVFGPDEPGRIGTWLCRGTFNFDLADIVAGAVPHVATTQAYLVPPSFDPEQELVADETLEREGLEGGIPTLRILRLRL